MPEETPAVLTKTDSKPEFTEVLDKNGKTIGASASLSNIFDKIESGIPAKEAIKEVMEKKPTEKQAATATVEDKKEVVNPVVVEVKTKPDTLSQSLDAQQDKKNAKPETEVSSTEETVTDSDLQVLPHDKPKTAKRISALLKIKGDLEASVANTKKEVEAKQAKLQELETELSKTKSADPATSEAIKKQLDELAMYRRQYEIDNDPTIKSKYDGRIESAENDVVKVLTAYGAQDPLLAVVKAEGGWAKFASSQKQIKLADGRSMAASEVAEAIFESLPLGHRHEIEAAMLEQSQTARERARFIAEEKANAAKYFSEKDNVSKKAQEDHQKLIETTKADLAKWKQETMDNTEFLKVKPVPATATAEEKATIEADNKIAVELNDRLEKALSGGGLSHILGLIKDSITYYHASHQLSRKDAVIAKQAAEIAELKGKVDQVKTASRSVPRQGSISSAGSPATTKAKVSNLSAAEGLAASLAAIESGEG